MKPSDDLAILDLVSRGYVRRKEGWIKWAIRENPYFREDLSSVAEIDGKIVGTYLSGTNPVKLGPRLVATGVSSLIVVDPDYRRQGIGTTIVNWSRSSHRRMGTDPDASDKAAIVRIATASRETRNVFWSKMSSSPSINENAVVFTKMVSIEPLREAAATIQKENLPGGSSPFTIRFDIIGSPQFTLELNSTSVKVIETDTADVEISGEISSPGYRSLILSLVTGRLRLKGFRHIPMLFRCRKMLYGFLSALQSETSQATQQT